MAYNGSGVFSLYSPGNPVVTGTTISSTWANNTLSDIATGLSTAVCKDGQQTITANIPMAGFKFTGLGAGTAATDSVRLSQLQNGSGATLGTIVGTNTITAVGSPVITAYATNQVFRFIPANSNTGATTINIDGVGAKNIFCNGAACVGGEIAQNVPCQIFYDGTQFNLMGPFIGGKVSSNINMSGTSANIQTGANYIGYDGTDAGLSFDSSNIATFSNVIKIASGIRSASGTGLVANSTATTIFSIPGIGCYLVWVYGDGLDAATWSSLAFVTYTAAGNLKLTTIYNGSGTATLSVSGANVQVTQTSGGQITMSWATIRMLYSA